MAEPDKRAVFLSYASQDAEMARRLSEALRSAGVEVWFDGSELRGGDAWDQQIRKQIRNCSLFIAIVSSQTQGRLEGYFRREWKLASERTRDMADGTAFIIPVVIDALRQEDALVPEEFRHIQWMQLSAHAPLVEFVERIRVLLGKPRNSIHPSRGDPALRAAAAHEQSLAVLAFANISDDRENEYFSDGISEELIHVLSRLPGWRVAARTSAFYFKGRNIPIPQIARELNVSHVVEGSVRKLGSRVRVAVQLVDSGSGFHVWSKTFDRELSDIFALQDELAQSIMKELRTALAGARSEATDGMIAAALQSHAADRTENPEAYRVYLQARYFLLRSNVEDNERSRALFREAIELDPEFASAWAGLSFSYSAAADLGILPFVSGYQEARHAAQRSLALSPDLAQARAALVKVEMSHDWDWEAAARELTHARSKTPRDIDLLSSAILLAKFTGATEEAIRLGLLATELDPLNVQVRVRLAGAYFEGGHLLEAERQSRRALEISPGSDFAFYYLFVICLFSKKFEDARWAATQDKDPEFQLFFNALIAIDEGRREAALTLVAELERTCSKTMAYQIALVHARSGNTDRAFVWLNEAFVQRDPGMARMRNDPLLASLHSDSRWPDFVRKMRFPWVPAALP